MTNKYDAFIGLANGAAHIANFMDVTAERVEAGALAQIEYRNRLTDMARILRNTIEKANETFFLPDAK